jgi:hypothetical protein
MHNDDVDYDVEITRTVYATRERKISVSSSSPGEAAPQAQMSAIFLSQ